jgi:hypothetical protein
MMPSRTEPTDAAAVDREVTPMDSEPGDDTVKPSPDPEVPDVALVGDLSLTLGALWILSTFVTARLFESSPLGIFVVGLVIGIASIWLAARAMHGPGGARGRGTVGFGIALAIIGIAFSAFGAVITSILNKDSAL